MDKKIASHKAKEDKGRAAYQANPTPGFIRKGDKKISRIINKNNNGVTDPNEIKLSKGEYKKIDRIYTKRDKRIYGTGRSGSYRKPTDNMSIEDKVRSRISKSPELFNNISESTDCSYLFDEILN